MLGAHEGLTRRRLLGGVAAGAVAAAVAPCLPAAASAREAATTTATTATATTATATSRGARPNVLLVLLDDLGWGELGVYGQDRIRTPAIDGLARRGARFTQAYATPTCAPSRAALMQGRHSGHASVRTNGQATGGLRADDVTVAGVLREAGYRTALIGKWGLGRDAADSPSHPNRQGFDHFFGYIDQRQAHDYWPAHLWRNHRRVSYPRNRGADVTYAPRLFTEEALRYVDRAARDGAPFFLTLAYNTPHAPNVAPRRAPYRNKRWPKGERNHAAQITWTDTQIGKVVRRLRRRGLLDDTLVLVTSDNGPHREGATYGRVGSTLHHRVEFFDSNGPLRGAKRSLYEGGIRVPLVAHLPRSLRQGSTLRRGAVIRTPVALWDLFPTFVDLARAETPPGLDGVSLVPLLRGRSLSARPYLYWESHDRGYDQAVRWGQWKLIRRSGGRRELYDLRRDKRERKNLAARRPEIVRVGERLIDRSVTPR
ncbi:sulfatase-like hydrolase/transferase [Mumia sp. DW29H23]|uniref:sulfatase-like hydrolase/transferase n=1 Tax=Mumia sp. DW29H23 TaxID=3421241 RepID=UPI003D68D95D